VIHRRKGARTVGDWLSLLVLLFIVSVIVYAFMDAASRERPHRGGYMSEAEKGE